MSRAKYRKIVVNDVEYYWVAGRDSTRVVNHATKETTIYPNASWATPYSTPGMGGNTYYPRVEHPWVVRPGDVRGMILGVRRWQDHPCPRHPARTVTGLSGDPFAGEIEGKHILVNNCPDCLDESSLSI